MTQNARQLPARVTSTGGVNDFTYNYDANANITNIWDLGRGDNYSRWLTYDNLDRLTAAGSGSFGGDAWHRFTYDAIDNLKSWKLAGVKDYADYVYNAQNQLTNIRNTAGASVVGIGYDLQGNLANKNGQDYDFDYGNRLRTAPGKESYRYDGLGRRVQSTKTDGSKTTLWQYSQAGQMVFSSDWDGPSYLNHKTHEFVYLGGSLIATIDHNWPSNTVIATKYQHTDALGSPVAVTNEAGTVIERNDYEPWGAIIGKPTHDGIGYTGHVMDGGTGLTYMQQRYYDQSIGRFLSVDPVTANNSNGENFNRYRYANNNPYLYVDPDGRWGQLFDKNMSVDRARAISASAAAGEQARAEEAKAAVDLAGKVHAAPTTTIGLIVGAYMASFSEFFLGKKPQIGIGGNAIEITGLAYDIMPSAMTIGNVVVYGGDKPTDKGQSGQSVRVEEKQHTLQAQALGNFYLPLHGLSKLNGLIKDGDTHGPNDILEVNPHSIDPRP